MKTISHTEEISKAIKQFFDTKFPLPEQPFKNIDELLNYYVDTERMLYDALKSLFDKMKPVPYNKIRLANDSLKQNLVISFELNGFSEKINSKINAIYKNIIENIQKDDKKYKPSDDYTVFKMKEQLYGYITKFNEKTSKEFKREEFPDFLMSKYSLLIKNEFLNLMSAHELDVSFFYLTDNLISLIDIYQDIFINKKSFLFSKNSNNENNSEFFQLLLLSNNEIFRNTPRILEYFIKDFKFFVHLFNLHHLYEKENDEINELYNINKLIEKSTIEYINISKEESETKLKVLLNNITTNCTIQKIINYILSYTLILNFLVTKNLKTGEVIMSMTENYKASACIKELLDNTLNNFEIYLDVEEISEYIQSSLIKDLFISQNYKENKSYEIDTIKNMLINNSKNKKLKKYCDNFFKGFYTKKYDKFSEFIYTMSLQDTFNDNYISAINLQPLNPLVTSTHCFIFISGFLSEKSNHYKEWENLAIDLSSRNACFFYNWPGDSLTNAAAQTFFKLSGAIMTAFSKYTNNSNSVTNFNKKNVGINKYDNFDFGKSFKDSSKKAALSGKILALMLASRLFLKYQTVTLVGFSLGAHVSKHCIKQLYKLHYEENIPCNDIIQNVVLIAGATCVQNKEKKFKEIFSKVISGKLFNCFSNEDQILNMLYTVCMNKKPLGNSTLDLDGFKNLINVDFTPLHLGHTDYRDKMDLVMSKIRLCDE